MIDIANATISVIQPTTPGSYVDGIWIDGATELVENVLVSAQPHTMKPHEVLQLPEGRRDVEAIKIYTDLRMFPSSEENKKIASVVLYDNNSYEVHKVFNWSIGTDIKHYKVIALKIEGSDA